MSSNTDLKLAAMDKGVRIDVGFPAEPDFSRVMHKVGERTYAVTEVNEGIEHYFTYQSAREVLQGKRMPWSGDLTVKEWLARENT